MKNTTQKLYFLLCILLCLIIPSTCTKLEKAMLVSTGDVTNITPNTADAAGNVVDLGGGASQYGHCYGTAPNVTTAGSKTQLGVPAGAGGFTSQLTNLTAGTTYYIKAYINNANTTVYGKETSFSTAAASVPVLTTTAISSITTTTATSGGNITSDGGASVTARGVCWNTATGPSISNSKTTDGTGTGSYSSNLSGLTPGTTYYVRAYATNSAGTTYGNELTFTTTAIVLPTITTTAITSITTTTASSGGNITSDGGASVTARGVCWNTSSGPTTTNNKTTDASGTGSFTSSLTGLTGNTTYYVRAYATNSAGTSYGNEVIFITSAVVPTLTTTATSSITQTTASSGGTIASNGGATITVSGICWGTTSGPTTSNSKTTDGSVTGSFTSGLTGLTANTTYYVRAYATNSVGTAYGNEVSFTTSAVVPVVPTLTTTAASSITQTTASSGGTITSNGGATITVSGICWSTTSGPTTSSTKTTDGSVSGSFASNLTGLTANTTYYVRAYATNSVGTAYGNEVSFTTSTVVPVVPTLSTTAIGSITQTTASSGGTITSDGGATITVSGICWGITSGPTTSSSKTTDGSVSGSFTSNLTGLTASTTYYVRAYATNSVGTAYGNEVSFTTSSASPVVPTLTTTAITSITQTTATSGGTITSNGGANITVSGICWSTTSGPTTSSTKTTDGSVSGSFTSSLTGLTASTTYYVRAYATNSVGTAYGNEVSFTTSALVAVIPTIATTATSSFTPTTAASGGNITSDGGATIISRGVCWGITPAPTISGSKTIDGTGSGTFSSNIIGLAASTPYYLRAYATNSAGTAYGNEVSFTTLNPSTIVFSEIGSATTWSTDIDLAYISTTGNVSIYKLSSKNFVQDEQFKIRKNHDWTTNWGTGMCLTGETGNFNAFDCSGATNTANINVTSERTYEVDFSIDWSTNIPTLGMINLTPSITTTNASSITSSAASSGGTIANQGTSPVTARGVCWSSSSLPTIAGNHTTDGSGTGSYVSNIIGLSPNTTYHIRAYATNSSGTSYGVDVSFTTASATIPTLTTASISTITSTTAVGGGNITSDGGATVSTRGVCWGIISGPTTALPTKTSDGTGTGSFTSSLTGLTSGTTYYVRAYATNSAGTAYGNEVSFTTQCPTVTATISGTTTVCQNSVSPSVTFTGTAGTSPFTFTYKINGGSNQTVTTTSGNNVTVQVSTSSATSYTYLLVSAYDAGGSGCSQTQTGSVVVTVNPLPTLTGASQASSVCSGSSATINLIGLLPGTTSTIAYNINGVAQTPVTGVTSDGSGQGSFTTRILAAGENGQILRITGITTTSSAPNCSNSFTTDVNLSVDPATVAGTISPAQTICAGTAMGSLTLSGNTGSVVKWQTSSNITFTSSTDYINSSTVLTAAWISSTIGNLTSNTYFRAVVQSGNCNIAFSPAILITVNPLPTPSITGPGTANAGSTGNVYSTESGMTGYTWTVSSGGNITSGTGTNSITVTWNTAGSQLVNVNYANVNGCVAATPTQITVTVNAVIPAISTTAISSITSTTASSGGNISSDGGASVTARGICWSTTSNPTTSNSITSNGTGTGSFTSSLTVLTPNTTYYVRAYAINSVGTAYGNQISFITLCTAPTSTTNAATSISSTSATLNGTVNANSFSTTVTFDYGLTTSYGSNTAATPGTVTGNSATTVSAGAISLNPNTQYHFRVNTINCGGTIYGTDQTFTTTCISMAPVNHTAGSVSPVTKYVVYGIVQTNLSGANKCWITQNLGASNQASSATDASEASAGWYWQFNRMQGYKDDGTTRTPNTSWIASIDENSDWTSANDPCTILLGAGWRLPLGTEWNGVINNGSWTNYNDAYASILKLHAAGLILTDGYLYYRGTYGYYWGMDQTTTTNGDNIQIVNNSTYVSGLVKACGRSIRCLKD